jgi:hypothetical protein
MCSERRREQESAGQKLLQLKSAQQAAACHKLIKEKESEASQLRQEHLHNRYELAPDLKSPAKCIKIKEINKHEEQQDDWCRIKGATGDPHTGAKQTMYNARKGIR